MEVVTVFAAELHFALTVLVFIIAVLLIGWWRGV